MNYGYKAKLSEAGIDFIPSKAQFKDENTIDFEFKNQKHELKAKNFVIAAGCRPRIYSEVPNLEKYSISSDDIFSLEENPGKTLVVGGGYIAIECAGFLRGIGNEVTLINRSVFLRVFDQDMAGKVEFELEELGIKLMK